MSVGVQQSSKKAGEKELPLAPASFPRSLALRFLRLSRLSFLSPLLVYPANPSKEQMPPPAVLLAVLLGAVAAYFLLFRSSSAKSTKPDPFSSGSGKTGANSGTTASADVDTGRDFVAHMRLAVRFLLSLRSREESYDAPVEIASCWAVRRGLRRQRERP